MQNDTLSKILIAALALWSIFSIELSAHPLVADNELTLSNQLEFQPPEISLTANEKLYIGNVKKIKVGIVPLKYTPFDKIDEQRNIYLGISADFLYRIKKSLKLELEIIPFEKRDDAIAAVKNNTIDLLTTSNNYESDNGLLLSQPYITDQPALFKNPKLSTDIKTISIAYDYLPDETIKSYYPQLTIINYPTTNAAASAAAFGETDAVIMDLNYANSLINNIFSNRLKLEELVNIDVKGTSFSSNKNNTELISIINKVIESTPQSIISLIKIRWNGGGLTIPEKGERPKFNEQELNWINDNKVLNLVINKHLAPFSYIDETGNPTGYITDIMELFSLYSGIKINYKLIDNFEEQQNMVLNSETPSMTPLTPSKSRAERFLFSAKFSEYPYVYVKKIDSANVDHPVIAAPAGHAVIEQIKNSLNYKRLILTKDYLEALNMVEHNLADITIIPMNSANYYNETYFGDSLDISYIAFDIPSPYATFAVKKSDHILLDIIDKTLMAIPPNEIKALENIWQSHELPMKQTWKDYKYTIYTILISSIIIIIASATWGFYTRRHYRKRLEISYALDKNLYFMQSIIDAIPHPIFVRDKNRALILCNNSYLEISKCSRENILSTSVLDNVGRAKDMEEVEEIDKEYIQSLIDGKAVFKDRVIHVDGKKFNIYHWFKPYNDKDGNVEGIIGGWIDISDRVKLVEELEKSKEAADSASQAKSTFLATMSHEIRTPMNAIIGMLELALKQANTPQFDFNTIKVAYDSANGLLELIGDILDIARIEAGQLTLSPVRTNLKEVITSVVRVFDGLARQKGLSLQLNYNCKSVNDVLIDPVRVKQILSNLIGNAIKFSDRGSVTVDVISHAASTDDKKLLIAFTVTDTGIGISPQDQQKLFTPFTQVHGTHNTYGGTGLGLMICRSLCEMMGGSLMLESESGKGTKVSMQLMVQELDVDLDAVQDELITAKNITKPLYILIVDDHPANRLLLAQQLRFLQHRVDEASNGRSAINMFEQNEYQMVITDCNMPEISGYELSKLIRSVEEKRSSKVTIIGYTANAQKEAKDACLAAGMDDCIFKPITLDELKNTIERYNSSIQESGLHFAPEKVEKLAGHNMELVEMLLNELTNSNKSDLALLYDAVEKNDLKSLKELAHKIKGAAKIIDANMLVAACEKLESTQIKSMDIDVNDIAVAIDILEKEISAYKKSIKQQHKL